MRLELHSLRNAWGLSRMIRRSQGLGLLVSRAHTIAKDLGLSIEFRVGFLRVGSLGAGSNPRLLSAFLRLPRA